MLYKKFQIKKSNDKISKKTKKFNLFLKVWICFTSLGIRNQIKNIKTLLNFKIESSYY